MRSSTKRRRPDVSSSEDEDAAHELKEARNALETVRHGLQCGICMELLDHPCVVSPCGHIFCAQCLVQWFKVELHVNEPDENRGTVRRKKVCPSCRAHVVAPPLELWALKGILDAVRSSNAPPRARTISKDVWEGLFDPATFYHIIRDQEDGVLRCGACASEILEGECTNPEWYVCILTGSGIVYEDWEDDGEEWHRSEAVNVESDEEAQSTDDEAGSLEDFVVDDEEEEDAGSQASYRSSDSGIVSVSPPHEPGHDHNVTAARSTDSNTRRARLDALLASRARRHGTNVRVRAPSSDEDEEEEASSSGGASMSSDIAALEDPNESESDSM